MVKKVIIDVKTGTETIVDEPIIIEAIPAPPVEVDLRDMKNAIAYMKAQGWIA